MSLKLPTSRRCLAIARNEATAVRTISDGNKPDHHESTIFLANDI